MEQPDQTSFLRSLGFQAMQPKGVVWLAEVARDLGLAAYHKLL